jgi:hypothetical protein
LIQLRVAVERRRRIDERSEIDVRTDAARSNHGRALLKHRGFAKIAANRRQQGQLVECLMKGSV